MIIVLHVYVRPHHADQKQGCWEGEEEARQNTEEYAAWYGKRLEAEVTAAKLRK